MIMKKVIQITAYVDKLVEFSLALSTDFFKNSYINKSVKFKKETIH